MTKSLKKQRIRLENDSVELTAEELVTEFLRIRDPEVRASIVALVARLAEAEASSSEAQKRPLIS